MIIDQSHRPGLHENIQILAQTLSISEILDREIGR